MGLFSDFLGGVGGFVGDLAGGGDRDQAMYDIEKARRQYEQLNPNMAGFHENMVQQGPSAYLSADPATRQAQMQAMSSMMNTANQGGLDAISRANLNDVQNQSAQQARAGQAAVMQDAARRGQANSNSSLVAQMLAGQQGAQQGAQNSLNVAAQAQANRNAALSGAANLGGAIRGQDYEKAAAQDAISRFNAQNATGINSRNMDRSMQAQQQTFNNGMAKAGGVAGGYYRQADQYNQNAENEKRRWSALGTGIGAVGDGIAKSQGFPTG